MASQCKKKSPLEWFVSQFIISALFSLILSHGTQGLYLHLVSSRIKCPKLSAWIPPVKQIVDYKHCLREFHGKDSTRKASTYFLPLLPLLSLLLLRLPDLAANLPGPRSAQLERLRHRLTELGDGDCDMAGLDLVENAILTMNSSLSLGRNKLLEYQSLIIVKLLNELKAVLKDWVRGLEVFLQHVDSCQQFRHGGTLGVVETDYSGINGLVLLSNSVPDLGISAKCAELEALKLHDLTTHSIARFACDHVSDRDPRGSSSTHTSWALFAKIEHELFQFLLWHLQDTCGSC